MTPRQIQQLIEERDALKAENEQFREELIEAQNTILEQNQELFEWERGERVRLTPEESEERYRQYREADIVLQLLDELDGCEKNAASKGRKTKRQKQAKSKPSKRKNAHRAPHQENATIEGNPAPSQSASGPEFVGAFARLGLRAHPQTMPQGNELN